MARIIAIDRRPRVVNRRMLTDARGATCCCRDVARLYLFRECCDNLPRFAVTQAVRDELVRRCSLTLGNFPTILVHQLGDQTKTCYSLDMTVGGTVTRDEAIAAGYPIIEDATRLECVDRTRPDLQPARCFASPTECRECPRQCCLTAIWRKACPDVQVVDALPKANVCCSYGRKARRIYRTSMRYENVSYLTLNTAAVPDAWCPYVGCLQELFGQRVNTQRDEEDVSVYTACPDVLPPDNNAYICERRSVYTRDASTTRRWAFADPRPTDTDCLTHEDTVSDQEYRNNDCGPDYGLIPATFPRRLGRNRRPRPLCDELVFGGSEPVCNDIDETCVEVDLQYGTTRTTRTIFRYGVTCNQGSAFFRQEVEVRSNAGVSAPCAPDKLISRSTFEQSWSYSIQVLDRRECPTNVCDGYARDGTISTFPVTPIGPQPIESGAFLFL